MIASTIRMRQFGVSLIELMVAMVIGLFLILGAVTVFSQSRSTYRTAESVARLQEVGRLAMDVVETDVRMANFWGMSNHADYIDNRTPIGQSPPAALDATQQANAAVCGTTTAPSNYFVLNLDEYVGGSNNSYGLTCAANNYLAGTDTLWIRRANGTQPAALDSTRIYLQTSRIRGTLFVPACTDPTDQGCIPADYLPPASQSRELEAHVYYVSSRSTNRNDVPSLRRKRFANASGAPGNAFVDEEIVPGVEDLQVRLGVDTNGDTNIDQYVNPGAVPANGVVVSATIWLRIRAEEPEIGFVNDTGFQYADMGAVVTPGDNYRRILLTKTIHIRNTRA
ncbi:MAG: PilW family protein [Proteobacteria bacterium]|nr:PilW family protein [Pseudomonadota bacterium]